MVCEFQKLIYPSSASMAEVGSYMVALYRPCEKVVDTSGKAVREVKAVGYCLPVAANLRYDMKGHWSNNPSHGLQFEVEKYDEVIVPSKEGIVAYLSSGQIKGIGPVMAERIFDTFGMKTLDVLDKEPERLVEIRGISSTKLEKITQSYLENRGARDVVAFLTPHGITANRAVQFYREYGNKAMEIVQNHPYRLCEIDGIGFRTADRIALNMGVSRLSPERVDEGILYTLKEQEGKGHLCIKKEKFIKECMKTLDTPELTGQMIGVRASRMVYSGKLVMYQDCVYRKKTSEAEDRLAKRVKEMLKQKKSFAVSGLEQEVAAEEKELGLIFAEEQKEAVCTALTSSLCVITGGPGTGKTMIQRAILDIYQKRFPKHGIICCAPTGRAARRMEQSTGFPSSTVHKALNLFAGEDGCYGEGGELEADFILVDEVSMLDMYVADSLFQAVKKGSRLVLVGDADQLSSVGPGAVLGELIASGCIPVVRLDQVFRQKAGSRIAANAKQIRHGIASLEYGEDFQFVESADLKESARLIQKLYLQEVARNGVDHVALLSPYRQKTETGVNALNEQIRDAVNPGSAAGAEIASGSRKFRSGDKVMQVKNRDDVSNGDIGYIRKISKSGSETEIQIDFGDGRIKDYDVGGLELLDLGYATTIHKSQGSEYQTVIINIQSAHYIMLNRPLIYTAVTRGKKKVILVGEKKALYMAVKRTETEKRGTNLAARIREYMN